MYYQNNFCATQYFVIVVFSSVKETKLWGALCLPVFFPWHLKNQYEILESPRQSWSHCILMNYNLEMFCLKTESTGIGSLLWSRNYNVKNLLSLIPEGQTDVQLQKDRQLALDRPSSKLMLRTKSLSVSYQSIILTVSHYYE